MADGTGSNRILNSVASIATRLRDVETVKASKPNTTPPSGNVSGTLTLLDTPVEIYSALAASTFSWTTINVYGILPQNVKGIYLFVRVTRAAGVLSATFEARRDNLSISPSYEIFRTTASISTRLFVPVSQQGTIQLQGTYAAGSWDISVIAEGYLV